MWNFSNILFKGFSVESSTCGKIKFDGVVEDYLVIARHNILGIYSFKKGGMDLKKEIELFANIKFLKRIPSPSNQQSDLFFCLADDLSYAFCSLDEGVLKTKGDGEINLPSSAMLEIDSIKVIADTDHAFYTTNYSFSGIKYIAVHAYREILNIFPFKYMGNGEINPEKPFILRLSQENVHDIIPLDPRHYKSPKHLLGILYSDKNTTTFQALEFNIPTEEFTKKVLWDIPNIKELKAYKITELSDGGILIFANTSIK